MKKLCTDCGKTRDIKFFSQRKNNHETKTVYHAPYCKPCMVIRTADWVDRNRAKVDKYQKEYHKKHGLRG